MGTLTRAKSKKFKPKISVALPSATSSPASGDGRLPFASLGGLPTNQCGPAVVPVPRLASRVKEKRARDAKVKILSHALRKLATFYAAYAADRGLPTTDIFGRNGGVFYAVPDQVARSLESRLRARLVGRGSPLYALRWRSWTMVLGAPIFALRASERTTSGSAFTGWPTPTAKSSAGGGYNGPRQGSGTGAGRAQQRLARLRAPAGRLDNAAGAGPQGRRHNAGQHTNQRHAVPAGDFAGRLFAPTTDGKYRPIPANQKGKPEPALFPLVELGEIRNRVGILRGAGNLIDPFLAAEWIATCAEVFGWPLDPP